MQDYPKISIITPSYNQGQYIEDTILSVIGQGYPNLEYIIIDGGSTDNTVEIIKKYEQHLAYWVSEPDKGQSDAINKGLAKCTGEVFNWLNSDDLLAENSLFIIGEAFRDNDIDVLCGSLKEFSDSNEEETSRNVRLTQNIEEDIITGSICQPSTFYKRNIINQLGNINTALHYTMDLDLWIKYLLNHGVSKVKVTQDILAKFRIHNNSKTIAYSNNFYKDRDSIYYQLFTLLGLIDDIVSYLHPSNTELDSTYYRVQNIDKYKLLNSWLLKEIKYSKGFKKKYKLAFKYLSTQPLKRFKDYKQLILDYLFPKTYQRFKRWINL